MAVLRITLFGKFDARCGEQVLAGLDTRKVQELFCYLLLYRDRPHPREAVAALLWNDRDTDQPNRCLRKALWQLRVALDSQNGSLCERVLLIDPEWVQLNPKADLWLDVTVFEQAVDAVEGVAGWDLDPQAVQTLQSAVDLYRGGLQESWYQDWYLYERERFQYLYLIMLDKLMDYCESQHSYEAGLAYGTRILRCERARERTHRRLMRLYYLAGDRTAALRQYEQCVHVLKEELGVRPAARTVALYQQIRTDRLGDLPLVPIEAREPPKTSESLLSEILSRLQQLQAVLTEAQCRLNQDIQAMELARTSHRLPNHL